MLGPSSPWGQKRCATSKPVFRGVCAMFAGRNISTTNLNTCVFGVGAKFVGSRSQFDNLSAEHVDEMSAVNLPDDYSEIEQLIDAGDLDAARQALSALDAAAETYAVLRIKLALYDGTIEPGAAMQKLIQLMRREPDWHGAKALYQEASNLAYLGRQSSVSHSHPPPAVAPRKPES